MSEPNVDEIALAAMEANERMGTALMFIYRQYPHIKAEVAEYLADYPFEWQQQSRRHKVPNHPWRAWAYGSWKYKPSPDACGDCGRPKADHNDDGIENE